MDVAVRRCSFTCLIYTNSKRHNKFLLPILAKAIYGSFGKIESEISNIVNYKYKKYCEIAPKYKKKTYLANQYNRRKGL